MAAELLAGIDIGTTSIKVCIYRTDLQLVGYAARPTRLAQRQWDLPGGPTTGGDPALIWRLVCEAAQAVAAGLAGDLRGIAVAGMGCTAIAVDAANSPLFPPSWSPPGIPALYDRYRQAFGMRDYYQITGYALEPDNTAFALALLAEQQPQLVAAIDAILSVSDYINLRLTGLRARERSTAASMALWDYRRGGWWADCLDAIGLAEAVVGQPQWSGAYLGPLSATAAEQMGWPAGTPVYLGGHDYPCASLAAGCVGPGALLNVSGTYEILATFHHAPSTDRDPSVQRALVDHHVVEGLYTLMAEAVGAGHLEWLRRCLASPGQPSPPWEDLLGELSVLPSPIGRVPVLFVPHLFGRWVPERREAAWGNFAGLAGDTSRADLLRAIVEGICFTARLALAGLRGTEHPPTEPITVVGGGSREPAWLRTKAAILGATLSVPRLQEATALGAALLAGIGAGIYAGPADAASSAARLGADIYEPDPALQAWYSEVFQTLYLPLLTSIGQLDVRMRALIDRRP